MKAKTLASVMQLLGIAGFIYGWQAGNPPVAILSLCVAVIGGVVWKARARG